MPLDSDQLYFERVRELAKFVSQHQVNLPECQELIDARKAIETLENLPPVLTEAYTGRLRKQNSSELLANQPHAIW